MTVQGDRTALVGTVLIALGNFVESVPGDRTEHSIALPGHFAPLEQHAAAGRAYLTTRTEFIADTNDTFHGDLND